MSKNKISWHETIKNDPYEEYRDASGCRHELIACLVFVALVLFCVFCVSCKTVQVQPQRDSVRVELRHDSIYIYQHDSIFRDRWRSNDTVYMTVTQYKVLYKDKLVQVHDTVMSNEVQVVEQKYVPDYYKNTSAGFWVLLVFLIVIIGAKIYKIYVKIHTGGVL